MESFEGEILHQTDLLTPMGFALFPRTVLGAHSPDQHDAFRYQAIAWHVFNDWAEVFFYNTTGTLRPDGKLRSIHWTTIPFDRSLSDAIAEAYPERTVNTEGWQQDVTPVQCFWRMTQEYKPETTLERAPRLVRLSLCPITFRSWIRRVVMSQRVSESEAESCAWLPRICPSLVPTCSIPNPVQFRPTVCLQIVFRRTSW